MLLSVIVSSSDSSAVFVMIGLSLSMMITIVLHPCRRQLPLRIIVSAGCSRCVSLFLLRLGGVDGEMDRRSSTNCC